MTKLDLKKPRNVSNMEKFQNFGFKISFKNLTNFELYQLNFYIYAADVPTLQRFSQEGSEISNYGQLSCSPSCS